MLGDVGQPQLVRACAEKTRRTRSSWTGGPGFFLDERAVFLPKALHHPLSEQILHAVRLAMATPASRASSAKNR